MCGIRSQNKRLQTMKQLFDLTNKQTNTHEAVTHVQTW